MYLCKLYLLVFIFPLVDILDVLGGSLSVVDLPSYHKLGAAGTTWKALQRHEGGQTMPRQQLSHHNPKPHDRVAFRGV